MRSAGHLAINVVLVTACICCLLIVSNRTSKDDIIVNVKKMMESKEQAKERKESKTLDSPKQEVTTDEGVKKMYKAWKGCMMEKMNPLKGNPKAVWDKIVKIVKDCDQPYVNILKIKDFNNTDETKRHIMPVNKKNEPGVIVTLGIGHDTNAEESLIEYGGKENFRFYGADPMVEINEALYTKFGKFFPFAVSAEPGFSTANVLIDKKYVDRTVIHVDIIYFFTRLMNLRFFDDIWLDAEHAEYGLFPFINKGGDFDQNGIVVCMINFEIHKPDDAKKQQTHDFLFQTLEDERYAFFLPSKPTHLRLFFVNFEHKTCVDKYFPEELGSFKKSR